MAAVEQKEGSSEGWIDVRTYMSVVDEMHRGSPGVMIHRLEKRFRAEGAGSALCERRRI